MLAESPGPRDRLGEHSSSMHERLEPDCGAPRSARGALRGEARYPSRCRFPTRTFLKPAARACSAHCSARRRDVVGSPDISKHG